MKFLWNGERWRGGSKWELQNRVYSSQIQFWIWKARGPSAEISKMDQDTVPEMKYQFKLWKYLKVGTTCNVEKKGKIENYHMFHSNDNSSWNLCFYLYRSLRFESWEKLSRCLPKTEQFAKLYLLDDKTDQNTNLPCQISYLYRYTLFSQIWVNEKKLRNKIQACFWHWLSIFWSMCIESPLRDKLLIDSV